jgi:hypothetical protein
MCFQRYNKSTVRRLYDPNPDGNRAVRVYPGPDDVWTDDEYDKNDGGGTRKFKSKSRSKKRKSKRRKNKSNRR